MNDRDSRFRIAQPCPASWEGMSGDERKRYCASCRLHVHNLSEMERPEAESLLARGEGRICVSYLCDEQRRPLFRSDLQALAAGAASAALLLSSCSPRTTGEPPSLPSPAGLSEAAPRISGAPLPACPPEPQQEPRMMGRIAAPQKQP